MHIPYFRTALAMLLVSLSSAAIDGAPAVKKKEPAIWEIESWVRQLSKDDERAESAVQKLTDSGNKGVGVMKGMILKQPLPVRKKLFNVLSGMKGSDTTEIMTMMLLWDKDKDLQKDAARAMKGRVDKGAMKMLMSQSFSDSAKQRSNAARAIRDLGDPVVVDNLIYTTWKEVSRTKAATAQVGLSISFSGQHVTSMNTRNLRTSVRDANGRNDFVDMPIELPTVERFAIQTHVFCPATLVLGEVTGQDFGEDFSAWSEWWSKNRNSLFAP